MKHPFFPAALLCIVAMPLTSCDKTKPEDTLVVLDTVHSCTTDFINFKDFVQANQFGLGVKNLYHENIFLFASKIAPWRPINGFRQTLAGSLSDYFVAHEHDASSGHDAQCEYDWNIDILPDAVFSPSMGEGVVECEVTAPTLFRNNNFFPPEDHESETPLKGRKLCLYGPWVRDLGHNSQREIHPVEAIWWQNNGNNADVELLLLQDASCHRFTENADYDFDEDHDGTNDFHAGWAPWVSFPQTEEILIPFQFDPRDGRYTVFNIAEIKSLNIVTALFPELSDSDNGSIHILKTASGGPTVGPDQNILAEVHEGTTTSPNLGIQFTNLCKSSEGIISGSVRVLVAMGHPSGRDPGFILLRLTTTTKVNTGDVITQ